MRLRLRSPPKLTWAGLALQLGALACFAVVFGQLYGIEHPVDPDGFGIVINGFEAP